MSEVQWWHWAAALHQADLTDGAVATGLAWALHCWEWRRSTSEEQVLRDVRQPSLEEFRLRYRSGLSERSVRAHFAALRRAGLLEVRRTHSRWAATVHVPSLPGTPAEGSDNTGNQVPVNTSNTGNQVPVYDANSGTSVHQQRHLVAATPFSPEKSQTPLAHARTPAHTREGKEGVGGEASPEDNDAGRRVIDECLRTMPEGVGGNHVAHGYRYRAAKVAAELLASGWLAGQIVRTVTEPSWYGVASSGAVLVKRLEELREQPAPSTPSSPVDSRPTWCGKCDPRTRLLESDDGRMARCPQCHPMAIAAHGVDELEPLSAVGGGR
ncbi:hypothetical protein GALL_326090 [mine drainage metagenome]|uniref:Uncharacterized protein n=1 Tax=mine drainage metagenome TaxID=410659 RepID=A0A1J5QPP1_9ZZZZ